VSAYRISALVVTALLVLSTSASADSIISPFVENSNALNPLSPTSEIANYLAANYGIFLNFTDTSPANLAMIDTWYAVLFPGFTEPTALTLSQDSLPSSVPEPGTLEILGCGLAALLINFYVPFRRPHRPPRH